ncbi:MAG TPA: hypothetical protein EYN91_16960 [Candidatus Melainabacteria bacterium]|nr:hypothetical protein [Candidatus Melainabacteria bacterium]
MEIKLTLVTRRDPKTVKGLDSTVGAIIDADNNLVALVPVTRMDWVFDCLTAKTKTDHLFTVLSKMTDEPIHLCSKCKRNAAEPEHIEERSDPRVIRFNSARRKASRAVPV